MATMGIQGLKLSDVGWLVDMADIPTVESQAIPRDYPMVCGLTQSHSRRVDLL